MRVVVTGECRFVRTPDGRVWTTSDPDYPVWARYLSAFDHVRIVGRVRPQADAPDGARRVDGDRVEVWPLPYYRGVVGYLRQAPAIHRAVSAAAAPTDAVILRVPSPIGSIMAAARERAGRPYALEVIGDPYDAFASGAVRHPLRPLLRHWFVTRLRHQCRTAAAVGYETSRTLQARYPAGPTVPTAGVSCVDLPESAYVRRPRPVSPTRPTAALISVGSLEQMYKGIDTLLLALHRLLAGGFPVRLVHLGGGRCQPALARLAARLGVAHRVTFAGWLTSVEALRRELDASDLFVMPSRTEGMPRALIEAMARGLPTIASHVGGIPELLPAEDLVRPHDPVALAAAIRQMLTDPARLAAASARNLSRARDFSAEALTPRRRAYHEAVRRATERGTPVGSTVT